MASYDVFLAMSARSWPAGSCAARYSDPGFFLDSWAEGEIAKAEAEAAERRQRRAARRNSSVDGRAC